MDAIEGLQLQINAESIRLSILQQVKKIRDTVRLFVGAAELLFSYRFLLQHVQRVNKDKLKVTPIDSRKETMYFSLQALKENVLKVIVKVSCPSQWSFCVR